jgi:hypothetical protein
VPQPLEDHSKVVADTAQHGVHRVAERAFELVAIKFDLSSIGGWLAGLNFAVSV